MFPPLTGAVLLQRIPPQSAREVSVHSEFYFMTHRLMHLAIVYDKLPADVPCVVRNTCGVGGMQLACFESWPARLRGWFDCLYRIC